MLNYPSIIIIIIIALSNNLPNIIYSIRSYHENNDNWLNDDLTMLWYIYVLVRPEYSIKFIKLNRQMPTLTMY